MSKNLRADVLFESNSGLIQIGEEVYGVGRRGYPLGGVSKRVFDLLFAATAILLTLPVFIVTAIAVKLADGGPILFAHHRIGFNGRPFPCFKFRTMSVDAEARLRDYLLANTSAAEEWANTRKLKNDPRLTSIGSALRRSSIDELPQFFNVLRGEMSLVGPRPVVAEEIARYGRDASAYLSTRPGITGAWQVSGRSDLAYAERVRLDAEYCATWSFLKDMQIALKTIPALFLTRGSY